VKTYLGALGLDTCEVEGLFKLLDVDGSGFVDLDEFVMGLLRLKGMAKTVDVATLMFEHKKLSKQMGHLEVVVEENCSKVVHALESDRAFGMPLVGI